MQLAQVQALEARLITGAFKATSAQALNVGAYLTPIGLKLNKKADQTIACLYSGLLYHTLIQSRSIHLKRFLAPLEVFEKCYAKNFGTNIYKQERIPAYIMAFWWQPPTINISDSKEKVR